MAYIYIIGSTIKPYKIGITKNPNQRLKSLQTGHPNKLNILYKDEVPDDKVRYLEKVIHSTINYSRTKGEWFNIELEEAINEIKYAKMRYLKD